MNGSLNAPFDAKIYVAGHRGMVGGAIVRQLDALGYQYIITRTHAEFELANQAASSTFFSDEKPQYVLLASEKSAVFMPSIPIVASLSTRT